MAIDQCTILLYIYIYIYTILAVKKAGHLNVKTKMAIEYSHRVFASQPIRTRVSKLFLC